MADTMIRMAGRGEDGTAKAVQTNNEGQLQMQLSSSSVMQPTDLQTRYSKTVQTHSGVTVVPSGSNAGAWVDCEGFDKIALTLQNDALTSTRAAVFWSNDGTNIHGYERDVIPSSSVSRERAGSTDIKAKYVKVSLHNEDGSAPHTMNAWAYLKV